MHIDEVFTIVEKSANSSLKGYSAKVVLYLLSRDKESVHKNEILASQDDMARTLNISKSMVALGIKELKDRHIITATRAGRLNIYRFVK